MNYIYIFSPLIYTVLHNDKIKCFFRRFCKFIKIQELKIQESHLIKYRCKMQEVWIQKDSLDEDMA